LQKGYRGLPGGSSLAKLLAEHRGATGHLSPRGPLTVEQILVWAEAHRERVGKWPTIDSGSVIDGDGETWVAIDRALRRGSRGLPSGLSLPRLLKKHRLGRGK
jgi:hypothetical protein